MFNFDFSSRFPIIFSKTLIDVSADRIIKKKKKNGITE